MKNKAKVLSIALFLSVFIIVISFSEQEAEWKGTIEKENGIIVIKNPREPLYGEIKFELDEDLSIGNERDKNYLFYKVRDVEIDKQGNIFVADMGNFRVQRFDREGNFIQTIGRKGQGPGEFERPTMVRISEKNGYIYVKDASRFLEIFDKEGKFVRSIRISNLSGVIRDFRILHNENIVARLMSSRVTGEDEEVFFSVVLLNPQGQKLKTFAEYLFNIQWIRRGIAGTTGFETALCFSALDLNNFVIGFPKEYTFDVFDTYGKIQYRIEKEEPKPKYSSEEKRLIKKLPLPSEKPFYYDILTDSEKRIYIQKNNTTTGGATDDYDKQVDVFSKDGHFLFTTTLPANTVLIREGLLYAYVIDEEEGGEYIKRYKIRNWHQIKIGITDLPHQESKSPKAPASLD